MNEGSATVVLAFLFLAGDAVGFFTERFCFVVNTIGVDCIVG